MLFASSSAFDWFIKMAECDSVTEDSFNFFLVFWQSRQITIF